MTQSSLSDDVLTEAQVAEILGVKVDTMRHWRTAKNRSGEAPAYVQKGKGRVLYLRADVLAWLHANRVEPCKEN